MNWKSRTFTENSLLTSVLKNKVDVCVFGFTKEPKNLINCIIKGLSDLSYSYYICPLKRLQHIQTTQLSIWAGILLRSNQTDISTESLSTSTETKPVFTLNQIL